MYTFTHVFDRSALTVHLNSASVRQTRSRQVGTRKILRPLQALPPLQLRMLRGLKHVARISVRGAIIKNIDYNFFCYVC